MSNKTWPCAAAGAAAVAGALLATNAAAFEVVPPGEANEIVATAAIMPKLIDERAATVEGQHGRRLRGVHAKAHGCVRAELQVRDDIPAADRVGLLAVPGKRYDAWIRYSNAAPLVDDDLKLDDREKQRKNGSRGMALKILDVDGPVLADDGGRHNQDFLMINTPVFAFADVRTYHRLNEVLVRSDKAAAADAFFMPILPSAPPLPPAGDPVWGDVWAGFDKSDLQQTAVTFGIIKKVIESPANTVRSPLEANYFGAAPFLFGADRVMKVAVSPCQAVTQADFPDRTNLADPSRYYLREALTRSLQGTEAICLDLKMQNRTAADLKPQHIEDATTEWPDEHARYAPVARITIPVPQDIQTAEAVEHCEQLVFTPFHALAAHRPVGGINRLRESVYEASAAHRLAGAPPVEEP